MPFNKSKCNGQRHGVPIYGHCLLCTCPIETNRHGIKPNPDSFSRFLKLLSSSSRSTDPLNLTDDGQGDPNDSLSVSTEVPTDYDSFINSPLIVLCFTCHDKLIELNETYARLEEIKSQLIKLRNTIRVQLLIPYSPTVAVRTETESLIEFLGDFGTLRQTIVNRLGISQTTHVVSINLNELLPSEVKHAEFEIKSEVLDSGMQVDENELDVVHHQPSDGDSDYLPNSEDEQDTNSGTELVIQTFPQVSTDPDMNIQICRVELGKRIDEVLPVSSWTSSATALVPKEIFDAITTLPWSKFRAVTHEIYDCTYPQKCPIEGCTSGRLYRKSCYRTHIVQVHLDKRFPNSKWNLPNALKREFESIKYPINCPRIECKNEELSFSTSRQLIQHFRQLHFAGYKTFRQDKVLSPDLLAQLSQTKVFPSSCLVQDCKGLKLDRKYSNLSYLRRHLLLRHGQLTINNDSACEKKRPTASENHLLNTISTYPTNCPLNNCPTKLELATKKKLRSHLANLHGIYWKVTPRRNWENSKLLCPYTNCKKIFKRKTGLEEHISLVHKNNISQKQKVSKSNPSKSIPKECRVTSIQCHICGKHLADSVVLKVHLNRHSGNARYICRAQNCPKGFVLSNNRKVHERFKHWEELGLEPIQCKICGKYYSSTTLLSAHSQTHTGNFKHSCDQCDYKTQYKNDLEEHKATVHQSECPWTCEDCGKSYKLERQLKKHKLQHKSEDELFSCDICRKSFGTKYQLRVHKERIHSINTGVVMGSKMEGI